MAVRMPVLHGIATYYEVLRGKPEVVSPCTNTASLIPSYVQKHENMAVTICFGQQQPQIVGARLTGTVRLVTREGKLDSIDAAFVSSRRPTILVEGNLHLQRESFSLL